jgi:riboflavin synthase
MFTGIVEGLSTVISISREGTNMHLTLACPFTGEMKIDQSLSHNGVCLTITEIDAQKYSVTAIEETLLKTNLGDLKAGDTVNVERCMPANGRFDGHVVQGHIDTTGVCKAVSDHNGSWEIVIEHETSKDYMTVQKGSITVNGVSLTVVRSEPSLFSVHIIPYTFENTNFRSLKPGDRVNLEFDIIGKYVARLLSR